MKIDRLLSIFTYLLNRELVRAKELAEHFDVSSRTIQRDINTLSYAGIPITSVQGAQGGFGIMKEFKLDRQLVNTNDLYLILTALESFGSTIKNKEIGQTEEKIKSLLRERQQQEISSKKEKLQIDFSSLNIGKNGEDLFYLLENCIEHNNMLSFNYTDSNFKQQNRFVEPMTVVFKWFSWYLFAYCTERNNFRLFRISRMGNVKKENEKFERKTGTFQEIWQERDNKKRENTEDIIIKFHPSLKSHVEDYFDECKKYVDKQGYVSVHLDFPENEWLYGMILGYADKVEVIEPLRIRNIILDKAKAIIQKYQ